MESKFIAIFRIILSNILQARSDVIKCSDEIQVFVDYPEDGDNYLLLYETTY